MWRARSRTKFLELSCQGGTIGFEISRTSGITQRMVSGFPSFGNCSRRFHRLRPAFDFWTMESPQSSMPADDDRKPGSGTGKEKPAREGASTGEREPREARLPLTELLKRGLSAGQAVSESFFPRELASSLASQLVDARHGLVTAIASEVGRFLRQADIASEMRKMLAGLNVEAKIHLRFSEDDKGKVTSEIKVDRLEKEKEKQAAEPGKANKPTQPPPAESAGSGDP